MKLSVRSEIRTFLVIFIVLVVYFQSIGHPFSRFDDPGLIEHFGNNSNLTFGKVISSGVGGIYYRPIVNLSYWFDSKLWGMDPGFMHLENIVAHLINVFLVYLIASRITISAKNNAFPLFCALLFGLHPLNTESVNWIPGRADVYAGMFILFAFYCLMRAIQDQSTHFTILAFVVAFLGVLTKETAIMFIPAALLVIFIWPVVKHETSQFGAWRKKYLLMPIAVSFCLLAALLLLQYFKGKGDNALSLVFNNSTNVFIKSLEALGFYLKKLFLPLPLNVAILEVHPLYVVVGIIALIVLVLLLRHSAITGTLLTMSFLFTLPAITVATTSIAWTPFAERYMYIPSAFAVIGILYSYQRSLLELDSEKWFVPTVSVILVFASIATFQRNSLWGDNLALLEDIVSKSPRFGVARNEYGVLLREAGYPDKAMTQFEIGLQQHNKSNVNRIIRLNLVWTEIQGKLPADGRQILLSEIGNKAVGDVELLKKLSWYDEFALTQAVTLKEKKVLLADVISTHENLYLKTGEAHYLYRTGQLALSIGDKKTAATFFRRAYEKAPSNSYFKKPANKLYNKLKNQ